MDNSELRLLDDLFQEYAQNSLPRQPRTGLLYNASLPSNFTGVELALPFEVPTLGVVAYGVGVPTVTNEDVGSSKGGVLL
ncbi:G-box binding, multifunctional mosaic region containing protein [Tanacetum coccineum]